MYVILKINNNKVITFNKDNNIVAKEKVSAILLFFELEGNKNLVLWNFRLLWFFVFSEWKVEAILLMTQLISFIVQLITAWTAR